MENNEQVSTGSEIKAQRKNNRVFGFFLVLDVIFLALIIYEIVALATGL